jgi:transposase
MFYFGIDWSQGHHHLCICNEAGVRIKEIEIPHSVAGFEEIERQRCKLAVPARECLVAIETAHNLLVDYLLHRGYVLYVIPPQAMPGYRRRHKSSGARTDRSDAALLAGILCTDRDYHRRLCPNEALTRQILFQVRFIETLRRSLVRQSNQLRGLLQRTYPQALGLFSHLTARINLEFLATYPTAEEAQALTLEDFAEFCREHSYTHPGLVPRRYDHLMQPVPQADPAVAQACRNPIRILAELIRSQVVYRRQMIAELKRCFDRHPDAFIFASLPGAGEILAPALLAKFGDHRDRFRKPGEVQALAGTCPVTISSGKKREVLFRKGCDREFRRIAQQFARESVLRSDWARSYWKQVRARGKSASHAYRCLANRWLAIIWKMWQTGQAYDEDYHLRRCGRRQGGKR